jgi:hypothetical protein
VLSFFSLNDLDKSRGDDEQIDSPKKDWHAHFSNQITDLEKNGNSDIITLS